MATTRKFKFEAERLAAVIPVVTGILAVAYLLTAYTFLFMPKIGRLVLGGQYDLKPYQMALQSEKAYQTSLRAQIGAYEKLNVAHREKALGMVTSEPDFPGLLVQISQLCSLHKASCPAINVVSDETVYPGNRQSVRMTLNISGTDYVGMKSFLLDLERSRRVFDVESVIFAPSNQSFTVTMRAYYMANSL